MIWLRTTMLLGGAALMLGAQAMLDGVAAEDAIVPSTTTHKLVDVVLESGNPRQTLNTGYTTMETASIKCAGRGSCTIAMSIMQNINNATCTQEEWAIVGLVDGNSVDGGPYQSAVPGNGNYQTRTWQGAYTINPGKHTIAYQVYAPCALNANQWSVSYLVTSP